MSEHISHNENGYTRREVFKTLVAVAGIGCVGAHSAATASGETAAAPLLNPPHARNRKIRVAGLVIEKRPFDREANMQQLEELAGRAASAGAKLLVTPEGFLEGYIVQTKGLTAERYAEVAEQIPGGQYYERICKVADQNSVYLAAGMAEKAGDRFYNSCALVSPEGKLVGKYRKSHTLNDEPLNTLGDSFPVFETEIGRIGIMICYDRQPPETARLLTLHGADIILNPAAGSCGETNTMILRMRAYENGLPVVFSHFAECLIIDRRGEVVDRYREGGDRVVVAEVEIGRGESTIDHRRPELYSDLCKKAV